MSEHNGRARSYRMGRYTDEVEASVVELRLPNNAIAQTTVTPNGDGFLIRVWPANGTHEHGGNNMTVISIVVRFDESWGTVDSLYLDAPLETKEEP